MRKPLVAANWKMNGSFNNNAILLDSLVEGLSLSVTESIDVAIFPPAVYLSQLAEKICGSNIHWGTQNIFYENTGAYTGEISALMAKDLKCTYGLAGHSERRILFGESDLDIAKKVVSLLMQGITPILCVGETLKEAESGEAFSVIERQVTSVLDQLEDIQAVNIVIAYEPVWAIGTGKTASPDQAQRMHGYIRNILNGYSASFAEQTRILYGGSVKADNARCIFSQPDIDGGLIGSASLKASDFITICQSIG